jgi:hypothetical protein
MIYDICIECFMKINQSLMTVFGVAIYMRKYSYK